MNKFRPILFSSPMIKAILEGRKVMTRRIIKPNRHQTWLNNNVLNAVKRFAPSKDNWWTMAVGEYKEINHCGHLMDGGHIGSICCPYGKVGDALTVRETLYAYGVYAHTGKQTNNGKDEIEFQDCTIKTGLTYRYAADEELPKLNRFLLGWHKRPSIFMPKVASRISLEIKHIRAERLQDISESDAIKEGIQPTAMSAKDIETMSINSHEGMLARLLGPGEFTAKFHFINLWVAINGLDSWNKNPFVWVISFSKV